MRFATIVHPAAHVSATASIGEGTFVGAGPPWAPTRRLVSMSW